jgi:rhodanese-related sulfurtransferase
MSGDAPSGIILDVRTRAEYEAGHVPGARHVPFWTVFSRAGALPIARNTPITVYCGHGPRARVARAALRLLGFRQVSLLPGHMRAWKKAGKPLE